MSTTAQTNANRANAQLSTGPRSEEGKAASSQNSTQHGLAGKKLMIWGDEDPLAIVEHREMLFDEWRPTTPTQADLVEQLFNAILQRDRCTRALDTVFYMSPMGTLELDEKKSALLTRYYNMHVRHIRQTIDLLRKLKADEAKSNKQNTIQEIGFVSPTNEPEEKPQRDQAQATSQPTSANTKLRESEAPDQQ